MHLRIAVVLPTMLSSLTPSSPRLLLPDMYLNSSCHGSDEVRWTRQDVPARIRRWLDSATSLPEPPDQKHPDLRALFDGPTRPHFVSQSPNGRGLSWRRMAASREDVSGWLYGRLDERSRFTGDDVAFVYGDLRAAMAGRFDREALVEARAARVTGCRCRGGIMELQVRVLRRFSNQVFVPDQLRFLTMPSTSLLVDPLDRANAYVAQSAISGEGLFARRDLRAGDLVAGYAGTLVSRLQPAGEQCNLTVAMTESYDKNLILAPEPPFRDMDIDVPPGSDSLTEFRATLGHKANHGFPDGQANARFCQYANPRFGPIKCVLATRDIARGQEVLVDYKYDPGHPFAPEWFRKAFQERRVRRARATGGGRGQRIRGCESKSALGNAQCLGGN